MANTSDSTVSVIDLATNVVVATISVGHAPNGIGISPTGVRANLSAGEGTVIDTATNTVTATITFANSVSRVAVTGRPDPVKWFGGTDIADKMDYHFSGMCTKEAGQGAYMP